MNERRKHKTPHYPDRRGQTTIQPSSDDDDSGLGSALLGTAVESVIESAFSSDSSSSVSDASGFSGFDGGSSGGAGASGDF